MNKIQTLHSFWRGFGLKAYDETSVPDMVDDGNGNLIKLEPPYITYEVRDDEFGTSLLSSASLWYRDSGWGEITEKEQQIADFITRGGQMLKYDEGAMWIQKGTPWAQRMADPNDATIRRIVLSVVIEFLS